MKKLEKLWRKASGQKIASSQKILRFEISKFNKILESYTELLECISNAAKTNELSFDIDKLTEDEKILKSYVDKQFVEYSPEKPKKDEYRCNKNIVLQNISETHYRLQSLSIKWNQFNAKLFDFVHTPTQTTKIIDCDNDDDNKDENKDDENVNVNVNVNDENENENVLKILKIGAVEKLFRLRNDVISSIEQILKYCQPVELGYSRE